jgi:hypothetical protein
MRCWPITRPAQDRRIRANRGAVPDDGRRRLACALQGIVRNVALGPTNTSSSSRSHPRSARRISLYPVADDDVVFDEDVVADVAVAPNRRARQDVRERAEIRVRSPMRVVSTSASSCVKSVIIAHENSGSPR